MDIQLTISIVSWNVRDYLEKCLETIYKYSDGINFEIVVVDNASCDGSLNMVKEKFPQVITIQNNENLGYGNAHNQAIKIAKGKYIVFLNPDTEMLPDTLSKMLKFMDMHPEAGACQCGALRHKKYIKDIKESIILTRFDNFLYSFLKAIHKRFPNPITAHFCMNMAVKALMLSRGGSNFIYIKEPALEGSFLLVRMSALKQTDDFDPRFFHGDEGYDLTWRMGNAGWKLYRVFSARIIHYKSKSSEQLSDSQWAKLQEE